MEHMSFQFHLFYLLACFLSSLSCRLCLIVYVCMWSRICDADKIGIKPKRSTDEEKKRQKSRIVKREQNKNQNQSQSQAKPEKNSIECGHAVYGLFVVAVGAFYFTRHQHHCPPHSHPPMSQSPPSLSHPSPQFQWDSIFLLTIWPQYTHVIKAKSGQNYAHNNIPNKRKPNRQFSPIHSHCLPFFYALGRSA